jgi:hypothetical protein
MDIGRRFHNENATVQSISGAIGLFHTKELLRQVDLHTGEFSGEDLQRTLLIHLSGSPRGVVISDSIIETEVPTSINSLYMQRVYGWNPGLLSNLFKYLNLLLRSKRTPSLLRYEAFYYSILVISIDPLRLIAFPLIIFYPLYFVIIYLVYVVIETIPYLTMNRQDPYWIILIYPFYGLFGFITRIVSIAVFMYRRCAVIANRSPELDDYKNCGFTSKFASMFVVSLLGIYVVALPTYYGSHSQESLIPQPQNIAPIEQVSNNTEAARNKEEVAGYYDEAVEKTVIPESYIIPLEYGDGKTNIARKAIFEYTIGADIFLSPEQQKYTEDSLRRKIIEDLPRYKPGIVVELPSNMIIEEIYNVY